MGIKWGAGMPRHRTSISNWKQPLVWNQYAAAEQASGHITSNWHGPVGYWPVFCASLADVFDNEIPEFWRDDLWKLIAATRNLSWLLVTKRIGNVAKMLPVFDDHFTYVPDNVRILITVTDQAEADRDIPKLLELNCKNGVSYEPALGPVDWTNVAGKNALAYQMFHGVQRRLEWIIAGGESAQGGHSGRPFVIGWGRQSMRQCVAHGVPFFMKQFGSNVTNREGVKHPFKDRSGSDFAEFPEDLMLRQFAA